MSESKKKLSICGSCGAKYILASTLKNHVLSECSTKKRFQCTFCGRLFMTKHSLKTHERTKHVESGYKMFGCNYCEKQFASKHQVKVHERMHTKEKVFKCGICQKAFSHRESLVTHSTLHTGMKPYACQCCFSQFSCIGNLIQHRKIRPETCGDPKYKNVKVRSRAGVKIIENESQIVLRDSDKSSQNVVDSLNSNCGEFEYVTVYDGEDNENENEDEQEMQEQEEEQEEQESENIESIETITRYGSEGQVIVNEVILKEEMVEEDFKVEFLVDIENEDYIIEEEQENDISCRPQNDNFGFEEIIEEEEVMDNEDEKTNEEMYEEVAEATYEEEYTDELEEGHQDDDGSDSFDQTEEEISDEMSPYVDVRGNQYLCKMCPKQYQKRKAAFNHIRSDHNVFDDHVILEESRRKTKTAVLFTCGICSKKFVYQNLWRNHVKLHGTEGKLIHKCNCCSLYFATTNDMKSHLYDEHIDELECTLPKCKKIFDSPMKLKKHLKFSHLDSPKTVKKYEFVCEQCGKIFKSNSLLNDHVRSNCGRDPIYQCDSCDKFFRSMGSLKCHKTIHSNVLDFGCTFCTKRFRTKGQVTVHMRSHTKEKAFHCQHCPASFSHRESLITHNTVHTGIKRFRCSVCDSGFSCLSNFFTHRKNHISCSNAHSVKVKEAETSVKALAYPPTQIVEVEEVYEEENYEETE